MKVSANGLLRWRRQGFAPARRLLKRTLGAAAFLRGAWRVVHLDAIVKILDAEEVLAERLAQKEVFIRVNEARARPIEQLANLRADGPKSA